jgi:transcriptional regulator with XRE-family HTH domain
MGAAGEGLAAWLRARMEARGLSLRQLATYSGVSLSTLSRVARGEGAPRVEVVVELAEYFGEDPAEALAALAADGLARLEVGEDAPGTAAPGTAAREEAVALLSRLYALPSADRGRILHQLNEILDFLESGASDAARERAARLVSRGLAQRRPLRRRDARAKR